MNTVSSEFSSIRSVLSPKSGPVSDNPQAASKAPTEPSARTHAFPGRTGSGGSGLKKKGEAHI